MNELIVKVFVENQTPFQTYGAKDFNLTFEGSGDIVVRSADGILELRVTGGFKDLLMGIKDSMGEQDDRAANVQRRLATLKERFNGIR